MADQTVRIANIPDSGSAERVAMDLTIRIANFSGGVHTTKDAYLDLYAECLRATKGYRAAT